MAIKAVMSSINFDALTAPDPVITMNVLVPEHQVFLNQFS